MTMGYLSHETVVTKSTTKGDVLTANGTATDPDEEHPTEVNHDDEN